MELTRRSFMGMGAAAVMGVGAIKVLGDGADVALAAGDSSVNSQDLTDSAYPPQGLDCPWSGPGSLAGDWNGTPDEIKALGGCTMPPAELQHRRELYVNSQTEYTCADGTVIPEVYVKCHALINTYDYGTGNAVTDDSFTFLMNEMTEDEAQAFLDMPWGEPFTSLEFAAASGYSPEDAEKYCETLSVEKAMITRFYNDRGTYYCHIPPVQGIVEYHDVDNYTGRISTAGFTGSDSAYTFSFGGYPFFSAVPCSRDVVKDDGIYELDDLKAVWATKSKFSLGPCTCRMNHTSDGVLPDYPDGDYLYTGVTADASCGHDIMTCLSCGEEAQFWIDHGVSKEITYEEAMERLDLSVEQGLILERTTTKNAETICSCAADCCGILASYIAGGPDAPGYNHTLHYTLEFTEDTCIQCGTCAARCPMNMITMDEETGYPVVGDLCMACGQCCYVCPTKSRWLVPKEEDEFWGWYEDIWELNNVVAAQRFEEGYIW